MRTPLHLQPDYTAYRGYYQIKLPLEMETMIPADDPVRLLSAFVEGMDLSELYATYDRVRKNQASPRQILKIMVYAAMNGIFSSRDIETACKRDINFMFLLEGMPAPDHATLARFVSLHLSACSKNILAEVTSLLRELGEISAKTVFIDGTKIEANANKYTFVWKKTVSKSQAKLFEKVSSFVSECEEMYGLKAVYQDRISLRTLKRLRKKLYAVKESEEAYVFLEENGQDSYLKPQNYEISKTRKYKEDISRRENMTYNEEEDYYLCSQGRRLARVSERKKKNRNGYESTETIYECEGCSGCPHKAQCINGNHCNTPMEERNKRVCVSKVMKKKREETLRRITSEYGTQLRMNRSIQAEGSFAVLKEDMGFRQYLYRAKKTCWPKVYWQRSDTTSTSCTSRSREGGPASF